MSTSFQSTASIAYYAAHFKPFTVPSSGPAHFLRGALDRRRGGAYTDGNRTGFSGRSEILHRWCF